VAGVALAAMTAPARAATVCVNPGGTSGCLASLQAAVDAAASGDTIEIAAGTYLGQTRMPMNKRLTIRGAGPSATVLDAGGDARVLSFSGLGAPRVSFENLELRGGEIYIVGHARMSLVDCSIVDVWLHQLYGKVAMTRCLMTGGKIYVNDGPGRELSIVESEIREASEFAASGKVTVVDSVIRDSTSTGLAFSGKKLTVVGSTISGNVSAGSGGGLYLTGRSALIRNTTISGNAAGADGGGVYVNSHRLATFDHVTIAGNTAGGSGGGIYAHPIGLPKPTTLAATIVAGNAAGASPDCSANWVRAKHGNLIEDPSGCAISPQGASPLLTADPLLGPLQDNGGPTETQALGGGSPALAVVVASAACKLPDQRGVPRTVPCDLGAFEAP
jgi:predicted outer membrane repeat protein